MQIGYCIICHRNTNILRTTIEILHQGNNNIYLHVDKKANIEDFNEYKNSVIFIEDRVDVTWASFSQIECMIKLLERASIMKDDYICLLSGDCLPLKNSEEIKDFFTKNKGNEFVGIQKEPDLIELENNIKYEHSKLSFVRKKNVLQSIMFKIQNNTTSSKINKGYKLLPQLYKGANWFCISGDLCNYILQYLQDNDWYKKAFENSFCADEVFFQTIIMNSIYRDKIYKLDADYDDNHMELRYIDWNSGPEYPKMLTQQDFVNIKDSENSDCIFARKFSENIDIDSYKIAFNIK
ncbi:beta-1,6-N-acetylglucosaminyltransferase [Clostridium bowmanii]|uniref:beta-1,6-N-acetylglucosaminyltransferase n=1 Tax=Clostridium bowmanii TaxID=132925 RepID=UPI001C0ABB02|nr:beta-1,6-N-acetylglucosaminyltransferase [Clostridium bowmanii]MBU3188420.1 beta-1,6-N-acetylglucosaminyltransferase [Clostridium bowmanii]MCA1072809.1 beta-1,6-N-acetylglucosaminyltransferase [Clostridium bowmanii]